MGRIGLRRDYKFTKDDIGKVFYFFKKFGPFLKNYRVYFYDFWTKKLLVFIFRDRYSIQRLFVFSEEEALKYLTDKQRYCPYCGQKLKGVKK